MPPFKKRKKKGDQETIAVRENFVPSFENELPPKKTIEVISKKRDKKSLETIEKVGDIKKGIEVNKAERKANKEQKKKVTKKSSKSEKTEVYESPKITPKKGGYELIITEKPQAAEKIANALGKPEKYNNGGVTYYELKRKDKNIVVGCAVGHLFTLHQQEKSSPVFNIAWVPNFQVKKKDFTKRYYDTLLKLARNAGSFTVATDYDIEGEVIGHNVIKYLFGQSDAQRMKFSTLTKNELEKAYENKAPTINWGQAIAGETRHHLDWFYGINLSRALMKAIKSIGKFKLMSIGRVQGPALNLIVEKERTIQAFKPETYWQVFITVKDKINELELKHNKDLFDKNELNKFQSLVGKKAQATTEKSSESVSPGVPFDLTTLQTESYKHFGITPSRTLQIAQSLYLAGLISYPRTSSQKLPETIDYKSIRDNLAEQYNYEKHMKRESPMEGKKSDPAHPSIYPTGEFKPINADEEKLYDLIVKRFLALFCEDAILDHKKVIAEVDGLKFSARGMAIQKKGWMAIYPTKSQELEIPDMSGQVEIINKREEEKETQPPKRYSPASLVSELEKRNLGTKATRASILETLYDRGYVKDNSIQATPLGMSLITTLEKYSPIIIDEQLTRNFEEEMEEIVELKSGLEEKERQVIEKAKKTITLIIKDFDKHEKSIGQSLDEATQEAREQERDANKLQICPQCKKGNLIILYSRKTRRQFIGCTQYPECKNVYPLPHNGIIKPANKVCEHDQFPMLIRLAKGKRPWIFCFNPQCPTRLQKQTTEQNTTSESTQAEQPVAEPTAEQESSEETEEQQFLKTD